MADLPVVTVDVRLTELSPDLSEYRARYKIFHNTEPKIVEAFCRANPKVFVFPVLSGNINDLFDYTDLVGRCLSTEERPGDPELYHLVNPWYLGAEFNREFYVAGFIKPCLGENAIDVDTEEPAPEEIGFGPYG